MGLFRFYRKNKLRRSDKIIVIDRFVSESFSSVGAILFYPFK